MSCATITLFSTEGMSNAKYDPKVSSVVSARTMYLPDAEPFHVVSSGICGCVRVVTSFNWSFRTHSLYEYSSPVYQTLAECFLACYFGAESRSIGL